MTTPVADTRGGPPQLPFDSEAAESSAMTVFDRGRDRALTRPSLPLDAALSLAAKRP
jgi:hypothetical protein